MSERITLTGLAPAGLIADLHDVGRYGPFHIDPSRTATVVDREGHFVAAIAAPDGGPSLRRKFAELMARTLSQLEAEARRAADGFDPDHLAAVSEQSRALGERLARRRDAAE